MSDVTVEWHDWDDDCPRCGGASQVLTCAGAGFACYGDTAKCQECNLVGVIDVDPDDENLIAYVNWFYDEEEGE